MNPWAEERSVGLGLIGPYLTELGLINDFVGLAGPYLIASWASNTVLFCDSPISRLSCLSIGGWIGEGRLFNSIVVLSSSVPH